MDQCSVSLRERLLRTGQCLAVLSMLLTACNCLFLPFARSCYHVRLPVELAGLFLSLLAGVLFLTFTRGHEARLFSLAAPLWLSLFFVVSVLIGYAMEYTPAGDNFMLYNGSELFAAEGSFESNPGFGLYLARFPNQWGCFWLMTFVRMILNRLGVTQVFMPLVILQAALHTVGYGLLLRSVRKVYGIPTAFRLLLCLALFPPIYLASGNLYTDTLSLPFSLMAFALAVQSLSQAKSGECFTHTALLCGLASAFGAQIKMTVLIILIAAVLYGLLLFPLKKAVLFVLLTTLPVVLLTGWLHALTLRSAVDPEVYRQQKTPFLHWIVMSIPTGDNPHGSYRWADYDETWRLTDGGASRAELTRSLLTRMKDKIYTLRYPNRLFTALARKNASIAGDGTFGMTEMLDDRPKRRNALSDWVLSDGPYYSFFLSFVTGIWLFHLACATVHGLIACRQRQTKDALALIGFLGALLFLMSWETHSRYLFCFMPLCLFLSSRLFSPDPNP